MELIRALWGWGGRQSPNIVPRPSAQRRFKARLRAGQQDIPDSKGAEPAPSPPVEPEALRELSEVEKAMQWRAPDRHRP